MRSPILAPIDLDTDTSPEEHALQQALAGMMSSVARLAVARGMPYAAVEETLRIAFVQAAARAHPGLPEHRKVSRISTTTGIHRREVTRLIALHETGTAPRGRSMASEVFAHWRTRQSYRDQNGQPRVLPRQGPEPSFESVAHEVTRDVHPRSLLDELCRLGLATWDQASDTVALAQDAFVPQGDRVRLIGLLGDNVGDHLRAAVDNVLADDRLHFEQALFADGLSLESVQSIRPLIREQWQTMLSTLVPTLKARIESDSELLPVQQRRLRVGLYTYQEEEAAPAAPSIALKPAAVPRKN